MRKMLASAVVLGILSAGGAWAFGQEKKAAPAKAKAPAHSAAHSAMNPADLKWGDAPPVFAAGAKMAVLQGDPSKAGEYTVRLKAGDGYKIMPHSHPTDETVTVMKGTFVVGMGEKWDASVAKPIATGATGKVPAKMAHFAEAKGATLIQIAGTGPFAMTYVNPSDDPTKAMKP